VLKVAMAGALGRMGRRIMDLATLSSECTIAGAFDVPDKQGQTITIGAESGTPETVELSSPDVALDAADVLIDFTLAKACLPNIRLSADKGKPVVIGTTGLSEKDHEELLALSERIPIVYAPNMSAGVNLLFKLTLEVAQILGLEYNCEITEIHHNQKRDAPSGTAVRLAERAAEGLGLEYPADAVHGREGITGARPVGQIGVHAIRGGDVVGEHTVAFIGTGERIELTHKAHNRDNFARGALLAAKWVTTAPNGLHDMQDVLGLR